MPLRGSLRSFSLPTFTMSVSDDASVQASIEEVWYLKEITFKFDRDAPPRRVKIITQNFNGPCSLIAICNILLLRGDIEILPPERKTVSYEMLSQLVGEYLLTSCPDVDISAALSIMPHTIKGMDLNPVFTDATRFRPAGAGGELKLFEQAGIKLLHGWLVDPDSPEYAVVSKTKDYDHSVNLIVEADHISKGRLVVAEDDHGPGPSSSSNQAGPSGASSITAHPNLTDDERKKVEDAIVIQHFLDRTQSQLTYYGLFNLASTLSPGSLVALFRNSHLSVLYKSPNPDDSALYSLVTDHVFLHEPSVVWERVEDVEGGASTFVDSEFVRASPAGGDYAGHTGESALAALEADTAAMTLEERADHTLARELQAQEDAEAREVRAKRENERAQREGQRRLTEETKAPERHRKRKKECIIM
ncbi:unnamed protein product [Somion occarium]|uniref:MINDY deubiquitinase domain-containing protein n=1 Tax=Somion occarium TaxID=3059160 RepID=A0ABP1E9H2_9APHY